jgi:glycerate 2-kinase
MKIVVAPASFKGSLSAVKVASIISKTISKLLSDAEIVEVPISDGGEGLVDNLLFFLGGEKIEVTVHDPLMRKIQTYYGILPDKTAIIEMASASGLTLLTQEERNPLITTTYGTGELILHAIESGCKSILIGAGGSATCDCGTGALSALGIKFLDSIGEVVEGTGSNLIRIKQIDESSLENKILNSNIKVICDVTNPLYGENGAAHVFAPQKGASHEDVTLLEDNLKHFADITEKHLSSGSINIEHAGAAGGLAAGLFAFAKAELVNGIQYVLDKINFNSLITNCDLIITGEGYLDYQTKFSKAPYGVAKRAKKMKIKTLMLTGDYDVECKDFYKDFFDDIFSMSELSVSKNESIAKAEYYLEQTVIRAIKSITNK